MHLYATPPLETRLEDVIRKLEDIISENSITSQQFMQCAELVHHKYQAIANIINIENDITK